jgi:hypothetical protein
MDNVVSLPFVERESKELQSLLFKNFDNLARQAGFQSSRLIGQQPIRTPELFDSLKQIKALVDSIENQTALICWYSEGGNLERGRTD